VCVNYHEPGRRVHLGNAGRAGRESFRSVHIGLIGPIEVCLFVFHAVDFRLIEGRYRRLGCYAGVGDEWSGHGVD
jgi:hypothetical protein